MREDQILRIRSGFRRGYEIIAGDLVTYIDPEGNEHPLTSVSEDIPYESALPLHENVKAQQVREFIFLKDILDENGVTLDPNGHFVIEGIRWDFQLGGTVNDHLFAPGGIHNIVVVRLRQSVAVEEATSDPEWAYVS